MARTSQTGAPSAPPGSHPPLASHLGAPRPRVLPVSLALSQSVLHMQPESFTQISSRHYLACNSAMSFGRTANRTRVRAAAFGPTWSAAPTSLATLPSAHSAWAKAPFCALSDVTPEPHMCCPLCLGHLERLVPSVQVSALSLGPLPFTKLQPTFHHAPVSCFTFLCHAIPS